MDVLDHVHPALLLQSVHQDLPEGVLLDADGHGGLGVEDRVHEPVIAVVLAAVVQQGAVQVGRPVVKGREEEAQLRIAHNPIRPMVAEGLFRSVIPQHGGGLLHRADGAGNVGELQIAAVGLKAAVLCPEGNVVDVAGKQHQNAVVSQLQGPGDFLIEGVTGLLVRQLGIPQSGKESVLVAVQNLGCGEADIGERSSDGAG